MNQLDHNNVKIRHFGEFPGGSELRIWHCLCSSLGSCYGTCLILGLGSPTYCGCSQKKSIFSFKFSFLASQGIWRSWTRDQIRTTVATYAAAVATLDHLTHCYLWARDRTCILAVQRQHPPHPVAPQWELQ